jgi:hypothetical protein
MQVSLIILCALFVTFSFNELLIYIIQFIYDLQLFGFIFTFAFNDNSLNMPSSFFKTFYVSKEVFFMRKIASKNWKHRAQFYEKQQKNPKHYYLN